MAEPTETEVQAFRCIGDICDWAGLPAADAEGSARAVLYAGLGCTDATGYRALAHMTETDYEAVVVALRVGGNPPTPIQLSQWRLAGHAARISAGAVPRRSETVRVQAAPPSDQPSSVKAAVKLSNVVDQGLGSEIPYLPETEYQTAYGA